MGIDLFAAAAGWFAGIAVNYLADILPNSRRLASPVCLGCKTPQPLLNYFFWPRRCTQCGKRRGARVWMVEVIFAGLGVWLMAHSTQAPGFWPGLLVMVYLGVVTVIDLEHKVILHAVSLVGAAGALALGIWMHGLVETLAGGAAGFGIMLALYIFGILFVRWLSRRGSQPIGETEGLGFGDVNFGGVIGLILGWPGILAGLTLAIILAGAVSLFFFLGMLMMRRYRAAVALPYGPFLALAVVILLFFRDIFLSILF